MCLASEGTQGGWAYQENQDSQVLQEYLGYQGEQAGMGQMATQENPVSLVKKDREVIVGSQERLELWRVLRDLQVMMVCQGTWD